MSIVKNALLIHCWACHTYDIESHTNGAFVRDQHGLPFIHLKTDYSASDTEQLRVRLEAFFELMR